MITRRIRPDELQQYQMLRALTYHTTYSSPDSAEEIAFRAMRAPTSRVEEAWQTHYAAFTDDRLTMMGGLAAIPYPVHFDAHPCLLMGIGDVATLPPYRRQGVIRGCIALALNDMYARGATFSYLYPFSTAFYRKFGYERCADEKRYQLLIEFLPTRNVSGTTRLLARGNDAIPALQRVYEAANARYNFAVVPDTYEFDWFRRYDPLLTGETAYLYCAADGTPKAYMALRRTRATDGFLDIVASRIAFADAEGFFALCMLVRSFRSDCRRWLFTLPAAFELTPLLPETGLFSFTCTLHPSGMVRVINVLDALKKARYIGSGQITLRIRDAQLSENDGLFSVRFADGAAVEVSRADHAPDAEMDIAVFSRLIAGACALLDLPEGDITLHAPYQTLLPVFYPKPCFMSESF